MTEPVQRMWLQLFPSPKPIRRNCSNHSRNRRLSNAKRQPIFAPAFEKSPGAAVVEFVADLSTKNESGESNSSKSMSSTLPQKEQGFPLADDTQHVLQSGTTALDDERTESLTRIATTDELDLLWKVANGEGTDSLVERANLQLYHTDSMAFEFGNEFGPLYILKTNLHGDVEIQRCRSTEKFSQSPVILLECDQINRYDEYEFVTDVFPMLAEILAREQAFTLSREHDLAPVKAMEVEGEAVKRAKDQEKCTLIWNEERRCYDIRHNAIHKAHSTSMPPNPNPSFQMTISSTHIPEAPTVLITMPDDSADSSATSKISTLAALDLGSLTLTIFTHKTLSTVPALYPIDALVSAILIVAATDETIRPLLLNLPLFQPRASSPCPRPGVVVHENPAAATVAAAGPVETHSRHSASPSHSTEIAKYEKQTCEIESRNERQLMSQIRQHQQQQPSNRQPTRSKSKRKTLSWFRSRLSLKSRRIKDEEEGEIDEPIEIVELHQFNTSPDSNQPHTINNHDGNSSTLPPQPAHIRKPDVDADAGVDSLGLTPSGKAAKPEKKTGLLRMAFQLVVTLMQLAIVAVQVGVRLVWWLLICVWDWVDAAREE